MAVDNKKMRAYFKAMRELRQQQANTADVVRPSSISSLPLNYEVSLNDTPEIKRVLGY